MSVPEDLEVFIVTSDLVSAHHLLTLDPPCLAAVAASTRMSSCGVPTGAAADTSSTFKGGLFCFRSLNSVREDKQTKPGDGPGRRKHRSYYQEHFAFLRPAWVAHLHRGAAPGLPLTSFLQQEHRSRRTGLSSWFASVCLILPLICFGRTKVFILAK